MPPSDQALILPRSFENPWQTLSSRLVYESRGLRVWEDDVITPSGGPGKYAYGGLPHPAVTIAALDGAQRLYLVRQWRYPWQRDSWELPGGASTPGAPLLESARRELREETGLLARDWTELGQIYVSASLATQFHLFLAQDLEQAETDRDPEEADMVARAVPLEAAIQAALRGEIVHAASISAIFLLSCRLKP